MEAEGTRLDREVPECRWPIMMIRLTDNPTAASILPRAWAKFDSRGQIFEALMYRDRDLRS